MADRRLAHVAVVRLPFPNTLHRPRDGRAPAHGREREPRRFLQGTPCEPRFGDGDQPLVRRTLHGFAQPLPHSAPPSCGGTLAALVERGGSRRIPRALVGRSAADAAARLLPGGVLDGTVFRAPIVVKGIEPNVKTWEKPITIARHAYGDVYKASEMKVPGPGKAELVFTAEDGTIVRELIHNFTGAGVLQGQHNLDDSIESFAHSCFKYALDTKQDLWFATKDTISKKYDHTFKDIFQDVFEKNYKDAFEKAGIEYFYTLIDDAVARVMKSKGGFIWACKNYDGDVMSDMISSAFGSLAMMTSVLVSPHGYYEYEAAHGTVQRHYYKHLKGEETSTNSVATIFAWTGALRKRGELDKNQALCDFADKLEAACLKTIESGKMTKDLALITTIENPVVLNSENFIKAIRTELEASLS